MPRLGVSKVHPFHRFYSLPLYSSSHYFHLLPGPGRVSVFDNGAVFLLPLSPTTSVGGGFD